MNLIYFAPVPWDSYLQRPHYVVQHFLKRGGRRVVWVDPYATRLPMLRDLRWRQAGSRLLTTRPEGLTVVKLRVVPAEPFAAGRWVNRKLVWNRLARELRRVQDGSRLVIGVGRPSSLALAALETFDSAWSFYDAMDDFPEFYRGKAKRSVTACENALTNGVDAILTPSSALWDKFARLQVKRIMLHNASEMSSLPPPSASHNGRAVYGYIGCISTWFDWSIVARLAETSPDAHVHVVGPCFSRPSQPLPKNITLFAACPHDQAVDRLRSFSVGLIPFRRTRLTDGVDPIKYYEYRGMGLPVLTTTFGEMARRGVDDGTYFMDETAGIERAAEAALKRGPDPAAVAKFRLEHTWERRFEEARLFSRMARS